MSGGERESRGRFPVAVLEIVIQRPNCFLIKKRFFARLRMTELPRCRRATARQRKKSERRGRLVGMTKNMGNGKEAGDKVGGDRLIKVISKSRPRSCCIR